jgi:hypothetical protein
MTYNILSTVARSLGAPNLSLHLPRHFAFASVLVTVFALPLSAQAKQRLSSSPTVCPAPDTTAEWFRKQRAWSDESKHDWSDDSLRTALLRAAGIDAGHSISTLGGYEVVGSEKAAAGDSLVLARLRALARERGSKWPTRSVVGPAGVRAVWIIAKSDTALARTVLHRMMEAGPDESPPAAVATMEDRLRIMSGRKQLYGTQLVRGNGGALEPAPIEDPRHVDMRRDAAGLPPLAQALCAARIAKS